LGGPAVFQGEDNMVPSNPTKPDGGTTKN